MEEALKGIASDLGSVREDMQSAERYVALLRERESRLLEARKLLGGTEAKPAPEPEPEEPSKRKAKRRKSAAVKSASTAPQAGRFTSQAAAAAMESYLRSNGHDQMTGQQLGEAIGLAGRGAHMVRQAALKSLVAAKVVVEVNGTSEDGSPLYALRKGR